MNLALLTIAKESGNAVTPNFSSIFDSAKMFEIKQVGTAVNFKYRYNIGSDLKDYTTTALTLAQLQNLFNTNAPSGALDVVLVFDPSANTDERTIAPHDLKDTNGNVFVVPDNTRVWDGYYEVVTTFTSATDAATISLGIPSDDVAGIKAATAISVGTTWDAAAPVAIIQVGTIAAISEKTTAARTIQATVAAEVLLTGKFYLNLKMVTVPS